VNLSPFLTRPILRNETVGRALYTLCLATAAFVMIAGILRLPKMDLTEAEVYFGSLTIMTVSGICLILGALLRSTLSRTPTPR
jgi:hypothetical protein